MTEDALHMFVECFLFTLDPIEAFDPASAGELVPPAGAEGADPQRVPFIRMAALCSCPPLRL